MAAPAPAATWGVDATLEQVAAGPGPFGQLGERARQDLAALSTVMTRRLFGQITDASRKVDPNRLNLPRLFF